MPNAPLPALLEHLTGRRFSFNPPILNIEDNSWLYRRASWNEIVVTNGESGEDICVPRRFLGEVAEAEDLLLIVHLTGELEWRDGVVLPRVSRVIEFPAGRIGELTERSQFHRRAPVVNIRLERKRGPGVRKWIGVALLLGVVAWTIINDVARASGAMGSHDRHSWSLPRLAFLR